MSPGRARSAPCMPRVSALLLAARRRARPGAAASGPNQGADAGAPPGARLRPRLRRGLRRRRRRAGAGLPPGASPILRGDRRRRRVVAHLLRSRQPAPRSGVQRARQRGHRTRRAVGSREPDRAEAWFYLGAAYGVRVQYHGQRSEYLAAARDGKRIKVSLEKAIALDPGLQDANFGARPLPVLRRHRARGAEGAPLAAPAARRRQGGGPQADAADARAAACS